MNEDHIDGPMPQTGETPDLLFAGLQALAQDAFPKHCRNCDRIFDTVEDYLSMTLTLPGGRSGLKQGRDDDGKVIVELFRNCVCGSTLMDCFTDRRDTSERGLKRRARFGELLDLLVIRGLDRDTARQELLKIMKGQASDILRVVGNKKISFQK